MDITQQNKEEPVSGQYPLFLGSFDEKKWLEWAERIFAEANQHHFSDELPPYRIEFRRGMTATAGNIRPAQRLIRISINYHEHHNTFDEFRSTLLHEMIHARQHVQHKRLDHGAEFKKTALALGTHTRAKDLPSNQKRRPYALLIYCVGCEKGAALYTRRLRGGVHRYQCRYCGGRLREYRLKTPRLRIGSHSLRRLINLLKKRRGFL